jgi:type VI secretion system secreted protein VgrG
MNSARDFLRLVQYEQSLSTANRQLQLRLASPGSDYPDTDRMLLPQRVVGVESICGGIEYHVACLANSPHLPLKELIALPAEIKFVTDRGKLRSVCGIVTEARAGNYDGGLAAYHLVVRDALAIMEKRVGNRIFRYQNELDIVRVLFDEWRHSNVVFAGAFEYELDPLFDMRQFPAREQTMQYNESDAAFVRRLLKRRGVSWYFRPGRSRHSVVDRAHDLAPTHTLVLFNETGSSLQKNAAGTVRYHREDATDKRDVIRSWTGARSLQPGRSTRHSWDYKNPLGAQFMTTSAIGTADQGSNGNELAASLDDYMVEVPHWGNDVEDHWRLGHLRMSRHNYGAKCFYGEGCVRDFCAGEYFTLVGHPEIDTHPETERDFIITELEVTARNNLPKDLTARAERLFAHGRRPLKQDSGDVDRAGLVQIRFTAVRRGVPIVPDFDPRVDLPHPQLQSAIVVGPPNEEVHCDALGRVKIRFPVMRVADHKHAHGSGAPDGPGDSAWVRVASNWAGSGPGSQHQCGTLGLPRVGTEILVSFLGGDPDKPIIVGQVFNQRGEPPALSPRGGLPGNRYLSGMKSSEVGGQRGNQLRFDDTRGQISAQLASDHGTSQLNLGYLTDPRADGAGKPRGEGAELRSDDAVAIRAAQGVLITAEPAPQAEGAQLGRAGLIGLAEVMQSVANEMARLAKEHAGDEDTGRLAELADKLKRWDAGSNVAAGGAAGGGAPIVAVTAPAGIVVASADNLALGSEKMVNVVSAGDAEVAAGRNIFMRAARSISAFAHQLGIKLVAGRGNVTMQAHQGEVRIHSSGRISLVSAEGIDLQAPEVRVVAQGTQTDWASGTITQQSAGQHIVKAAQFVRTGPGVGDPARPDFASTRMRADERVVLRHTQTDAPLPNIRYAIELDDGSTIEGVTDREGHSSLLVSELIRVAKVTFFED